jgi:hypothetical protein
MPVTTFLQRTKLTHIAAPVPVNRVWGALTMALPLYVTAVPTSRSNTASGGWQDIQ